jgi:hypothetical protein
MAESAGKQLLLSALTEGHEKRSKTSKSSQQGKSASKSAATGSEKGSSRNSNKRQKSVNSGGQIVTSSSSAQKCKYNLFCCVEKFISHS